MWLCLMFWPFFTFLHCELVVFLSLRLSIQYCRVPKNGLPKNGQAGISPKFKNVLRLEK